MSKCAVNFSHVFISQWLKVKGRMAVCIKKLKTCYFHICIHTFDMQNVLTHLQLCKNIAGICAYILRFWIGITFVRAWQMG